MFAYDSNPARAAEGAETADTLAELFTKLRLSLGGKRTKLGVGLEGRTTSHSEQTAYDLMEGVGTADFSWTSTKFKFALDGRFAHLTDPVDVSTLTLSTLERDESSFRPLVAFSLGKMGFNAAVLRARVDYRSGELRDIDHDQTENQVEFWLGRPERKVFYLHGDVGGVDYHRPGAPHSDFTSAKYYGGLRSSPARPMSFDIAAGMWSVESDGFDVPDGVYAKIQTLKKRKNGTGEIRFAFETTSSASATANLKTQTDALISYASRANHTWERTAGLRAALIESTEPDSGTPESFAVTVIDLGLKRNLGSPGAWHGQLILDLDFELGDGFQRTKASVGVSLAH